MAREVLGKSRTRGWGLAPALGVVLAVSLSGCASRPALESRDVVDANDTGSALAARSDLERAVLSAVSTLPSGQPRQLAGSTVIAEPAYASASGRTCRALSLSPDRKVEKSHRLACTNGGSWFFVPEVFGAALLRD